MSTSSPNKKAFPLIRAGMRYRNSNATHQDDDWAEGTSGEVMLPIAIYLCYLHSYGLRGAVLECGVFKGVGRYAAQRPAA